MHLTIIGWIAVAAGFGWAAWEWVDIGLAWRHNPRRKWQQRFRPVALFLIMLGFGLAAWLHLVWAAAAFMAGVFCWLLEEMLYRQHKSRLEMKRRAYLL